MSAASFAQQQAAHEQRSLPEAAEADGGRRPNFERAEYPEVGAVVCPVIGGSPARHGEGGLPLS